MIDFLSAHKTIVLIINLVGLWLSFLVNGQEKKEKINKIFVLMFLLMAFWVDFAYLARLFGGANIELSELSLRIAWFVTPPFFVSLYLFVIALFQKEKEYKNLTIIVLLLGIASSILTGFTDLIISDVEFVGENLSIIYGEGMIPFLGIVFFLIYATLQPLFKNYFSSSIIIKQKVQYFLIGIFIFYVGNIVFNIALPLFFNTVNLYYFGDYSAIFLLGFTAYAIVEKKLFGIKIALTALLVALISFLVAIDIAVLTTDLTARIFKSLLLMLFLYFGYLLIKSVTKEIEYRERLQKAYKDLQKLDKAKSEFISIASHQLRTPLSAIKGYVSMLSEGTYGDLPEKTEKPLNNVYKANERLIKLVNNLLNLSRIESGKIELKFDKYSLEEIIEETIDSLKKPVQKKNLYIKFEKPKKSLPKIFMDKSKMVEILTNLIDNAIKYTTEGGITITLKSEKIKEMESAVIKITDTGSGMSQDEISKIFKSFSRGMAGTKLYTEGVGLGLYIAKKFVQMHKGDIKAESKGRNKGSTFTIILPLK
ncbi:MAG: ATP-binding protein [Patescibacteria group bacterium]